MNTLLNSRQIKDYISMVGLLKSLGYRPVKRVGPDLFYESMLEEGDNPMTFVVNEEKNLWFDHGLGRGGNSIDFAILYWKPVSQQEALFKIQCVLALPGTESLENLSNPEIEERIQRIPICTLQGIKELGSTEALTSYLERQKLLSLAAGELKEIFYTYDPKRDNMEPRAYYGIGWQNECGGWEVRNKYFRTCIGHTGVTFLPRDTENLIVFSDYFSYLVWRAGNGEDSVASILILNYHTLLSAALAIAASYKNIHLYLDRSQAGFRATRILNHTYPSSVDRSTGYSGYLNLHNQFVSSLAH